MPDGQRVMDWASHPVVDHRQPKLGLWLHARPHHPVQNCRQSRRPMQRYYTAVHHAWRLAEVS